MGVPRTAFRRSLDELYDYIDAEIPLGLLRSGDLYWVDSATGTDSVNNGTFDKPFATLDYAIGACTANNGDYILIKQNHAETITGVGGITADIAGITIIGLGNGAQRPRFLMDGAATVTFAVTGADTTIRNCVFAAGHADVATCFDLDAVGFTLLECEFVENVADENFLAIITSGSVTDNVCDGLKAIGNVVYQIDASATNFILKLGDADDWIIAQNFVCQPAATLGQFLLDTAGDDFGNLFAAWNFHVGLTGDSVDVFIDNDQADNSGFVAHNRSSHNDTDARIMVDVDGVGLFDNLNTSVTSASGFVLPVIDVDL